MPSVSRATPSATARSQPAGPSHTVQKGESLFSIAKRYGLSVDDLVRANPQVARNPHVIHPGQVLSIPSSSTSAPAASSSSPSSGALSGADRIIDHTARHEGNGRYDAWNPDDLGAGVSYGLIQFNQKKGQLPELLKAMHARDPGAFRAVFGPYAKKLLNERYVRTANLNAPDLKQRFLKAGQIDTFQAVQRELARKAYFDPVAKTAKRLGLTSERALAMLFDTAVQMGPKDAGALLERAARAGGTQKQILQRFARRADTIAGANGRRGRILRDPSLSDAPMALEGGARGRLTHVVRAGESLWSIARSHGTTWQALAAKNSLSDPDRLRPGQVIVVG